MMEVKKALTPPPTAPATPKITINQLKDAEVKIKDA